MGCSNNLKRRTAGWAQLILASCSIVRGRDGVEPSYKLCRPLFMPVSFALAYLICDSGPHPDEQPFHSGFLPLSFVLVSVPELNKSVYHLGEV